MPDCFKVSRVGHGAESLEQVLTVWSRRFTLHFAVDSIARLCQTDFRRFRLLEVKATGNNA